MHEDGKISLDITLKQECRTNLVKVMNGMNNHKPGSRKHTRIKCDEDMKQSCRNIKIFKDAEKTL